MVRPCGLHGHFVHAAGYVAAPAALQHRPDVAVLDIGLPGTDGITAAAELTRLLPGCRVLILTGLAAPGALSAAVRAGVVGYLLKDDSAGHLIGAVRAVAGATGSSTAGWPARRQAGERNRPASLEPLPDRHDVATRARAVL
jgi:DNA-binding NarL/FixJ family response regulator